VKTIEVVHQREYQDLRETWEQARSLEVIRRVLAELRPDATHFHHLAIWGSSALSAAREAGARVVLTLHDYYAMCDAATLLRGDGELCREGGAGRCTDCLHRHPLLAERWGADARALDREELYRRAARERFEKHRSDFAAVHRFVCPSRFLAGLFVDAGFFRHEDCTVMRYGYPGPRREARRRDPSRSLRVGFVGGVYFSKGVHLLVEAFARLTDLDAELHVHGHLDWFPDYADGLRRAAQGARVHFDGPFEPERVDEILAGIDVLVVPSVWYENMPLTISEAFRNGLPVIATDLGGMREAVRDGVDGLLFPRGDVAGLAAAIRRLASDAQLYDRLASARPPTLRLEEVVDELERIYAGA
jgi:glycosyltransferase involved in cell wall biosynthesis